MKKSERTSSCERGMERNSLKVRKNYFGLKTSGIVLCFLSFMNLSGVSQALGAVGYVENGIYQMENTEDFTMEEAPIKDGKLHGMFKRFTLDGRMISENEFRSGKRHGISRAYTQTGLLMYEIFIENGLMQGEARLFYENGNLKRLTTFKDGVKHGPEMIYDEEGQLLELQYFDNGNLIQGVPPLESETMISE